MPRVKFNERNDNNSERYLQTYVGEKSSVFKSLAEDHKKDVQMMEYVKKSCEELYHSHLLSLYPLTSHQPLRSLYTQIKNRELIKQKI